LLRKSSAILRTGQSQGTSSPHIPDETSRESSELAGAQLLLLASFPSSCLALGLLLQVNMREALLALQAVC